MAALGPTRSFGFVGSMSGLPESGHGCPIYKYTPWCPGSDVRFPLQHALVRTSEPGHEQLYDSSVALDLTRSYEITRGSADRNVKSAHQGRVLIKSRLVTAT